MIETKHEKYIPCKCGSRMIARTAGNGKLFFGCLKFPACRESLNERIADLRWKEHGWKIIQDLAGEDCIVPLSWD